MFKPLPDVIRLRRRERNLTQEAVAKQAGVSRRQLALFEDGANVSLKFLLKIARVLELTELPVDELRLRAAPPDLTALIEVADALETAKRVIGQVTEVAGQLDNATRTIDTLLARALSDPGPSVAIEQAVARLLDVPAEERSKVGSTLREIVQPPERPRARRPESEPAKPAARRRAR